MDEPTGLTGLTEFSVFWYLFEEAPWEFDRLESIGQLVRLWPDWGTARADPLPDSDAAWRRAMCGALR